MSVAQQRVTVVGSPRTGTSLLRELLATDPTWSLQRLFDDRTLRTGADFAKHIETLASESDTTFVYITRDPRYAVSSGATAWRTGRFVTHPELPGWWGEAWSFPLIAEWQDLIGRPLHEVVAVQWLSLDRDLRTALADLDPARVVVVSYEDLVADPQAVVESISERLGVAWAGEIESPLPVSSLAVTPPNPLREVNDLAEVQAALEAHPQEVADFLAWAEAEGFSSYRAPLTFAPVPRVNAVTKPSDATVFKSVHSGSFVALLEQSNSSVILTTYKSGHVIVARAVDGTLDTAITSMQRPMGIAVMPKRLAIGSADSVISYANHPNAAAQLGTPRLHDAVFVPKNIAFTGDIAIHEMDYDKDGELWFVNTRFSCLCTMDLTNSFNPRWIPSWITSLAPEDRCHLNGLAMVDGVPKYVTALARTDAAHGWREHKGTSGVIVDVTNDEVVSDGMAMPHSPRWHDGQLWVLESGRGALMRVDVSTGQRTEVARVPGFARGLAFIGRYALIGLSQVRESVFAGLPVTESASERNCGAWIVDIDTGNIVGQLKFDGVVQEIFDVKVLHGFKDPIVTSPGQLTNSAFSLSPAAIELLTPLLAETH